MSPTTATLNGKSGGPTAEDLAAQIDNLRSDLSAITRTIGEMGQSQGEKAASAVKDRADDLRETASDQMETARLHAMEMHDQTNEMIRKQPVAALGVAAGLCFLVGVMSSRK